MGCTIALSMAGQDPDSVKSVTLVSPVQLLFISLLFFFLPKGTQAPGHLEVFSAVGHQPWPYSGQDYSVTC